VIAVSTKKDVLGGKYCLEKIIGKGGSGYVYLAMDYALGKKWAVKELSKNDAMILNEVEMMRLLEHPMLPRIVDRIETPEKVYLVMDYLKGVNLQSILRKGQQFSTLQVVHLGLQLCDVLGYLHAYEPPVVYCDLKPSNILLMSGAQIRLIDFGCAYICRDEDEKQVVSTLTKGFAAPEQYEGKATIASDIYGLGATLAAISPPNSPKQLKKIITKCQHPEAHRRYKSIKSVAKALRLVQLQKRSIIQIWKGALLLPLTAFLWGNIGGILHEARSKAYVEALGASRYESAIEIFPDESKPYLEILKAHKDRGETSAGILKVENLLDVYASDKSERQHVYFAIGKLYFSGNIFDETFGIDYEEAYRYFVQVSSDIYPYIEWYQDMAKSLCDFGTEIDWEQRQSDLKKMEEAHAAIASDEEKVATLYATAMVYLTNRYYLANTECNPISESTRLLKMCREILQKSTNRVTVGNIMSDIDMSIARNYLLAGVQADDDELLRESYELYEQVLSEQTQEEIRLEVMLKLAYLKRCQNDYAEATFWYERAIKENQMDIETHCQYILMKLLEEQDIAMAQLLFEKASQIPGCENNKNYQTIKTRLEAIS